MRCGILGILLFVSFSISAQMLPDWMEDASRKFHYPREEWFSGFVTGEQQPGESLEKTFSRLKDDARVEAASSIRMTVEKEMKSSNRSELMQTSSSFDEKVTEIFESTTRTGVSMEIPGLKAEAWQNPRTKEISAFAYVSRNELLKKTKKQITVVLTKIELALDNVAQLVEIGQKMNARKAAQETLSLFGELEYAQKILLAISSDDEDLQMDEANSLRLRLMQLCSDLQHGIKLYIKCSCFLFDEPYPALQKELSASLSDIGCEFVESMENADWSIFVNANTRAYNYAEFGGISTYTSYVDAGLSIDKQITSQRIYEDEIHQKGTHTIGYEEAARSAFHDITKTLSKNIKHIIL